MSDGQPLSSVYTKALFRMALTETPSLLPVWFDRRVLDAYREDSAYQLVRTNSAGRLKLEGSFSIDFGIPDEEGPIHVAAEALLRLPARERARWLPHLVTLPLSVAFCQMQMAPGSCFDDGDTRPC